MIVQTEHALPRTPFEVLDDYVDSGGLSGLHEAHAMGPDATIDLITAAGVRGRGGAGFPTGRKWAGVRAGTSDSGRPVVVINAAEGEPGTFKDRALLRANPYLVLEGAMIAAITLGATKIIVATKGSYGRELAAISRAIDELATAGVDAGVDIAVVEGPDHYLFGEESALLEVVEGEDPLPRHLPPYQYGLFTTTPQLGWSAAAGDHLPTSGDDPALVNNVETYAHVALVSRHGADWYRSMGTDISPGPTIVTITGDVRRAAVAEIALGQPLDAVIEHLTGGPLPGRRIKAVLSGVSNPVLTADRVSSAVTYEDLAAADAGLGSAGFIVYDDSRNMIDVAYQVSMFLHVESCGQCNPCKTGTHDITAALELLVRGIGATHDVASTIPRRLATVTDASRCYLPTQERRLIASIFDAFPDDLARRLDGEVGDDHVPLPKILDLVDGVVTVDDGAPFKRPDWTYGDTPVRLTNS